MFSRDRLFFIAVGGFLAFGLVFAALQNERENKCANCNAAPRYQSANTSNNSLPFEAPHQTPAANPKPNRDEWREEQDLQAQMDMATWSLLMAVFAGLGVAVTGVGVWYVARTLKATRDAVKLTAKGTEAAQKAAEATERAVEATERVGNAQIRAYLVVTECFMSASADRTRPVFRIKIKNSGQTPAKNIQCRHYIFYDFEPWDYGNGYKGHPFRDLAAGESDNLMVDFETPIFPEDGKFGDNHMINAHFILLYNTVVDEEDRIDAFYFTFAGSLSGVTALAGSQVKMGQITSPKANWRRLGMRPPDPEPDYEEDENTGH